MNVADRDATRPTACYTLACALLVTLSGCQPADLPTEYGRRQGPLGTASVNGTDVLAGMFTAAGREVVSRRSLITSAMESVDAVIWFPDDFSAPSEEVCQWLDDWLDARAGRTLVYVGRDYDAAPVYWATLAPKVSPEQRGPYRDREQFARMQSFVRPRKSQCAWFSFERGEPRMTKDLSGPWSAGIAMGRAEIPLGARLIPREKSKPLLNGDGDALVTSHTRDNGSRLISIVNGAFLLNLPLVNHEHRKLAGKLVESLGPARRIMFLESSPGGPPLDPPATDSSLWRVFGAWPLSVILLHFAVLGVIFCFARWPIFGRPLVGPAETSTDFGEHVEAVGKLLRRARDRDYALSKLPKPEMAEPPARRK